MAAAARLLKGYGRRFSCLSDLVALMAHRQSACWLTPAGVAQAWAI
jgi:hypothetical protein